MYGIQTYPMSAFASCTHCALWDLWAFVACRNDLAVCFQIKISMRFYKSKGNIRKHELENRRELGSLLQRMSVTICHLPAPCVRSWLYHAWNLKEASLDWKEIWHRKPESIPVQRIRLVGPMAPMDIMQNIYTKSKVYILQNISNTASTNASREEANTNISQTYPIITNQCLALAAPLA